MAVTLDALERQKLETTIPLDLDLQAGTVIETEGANTDTIFTPYNLVAVNPTTFNVANVVVANASDTITTTGNGFANVKVGDAVTGTGIPASTTVVTKPDSNTLTISQAATAPGTITASFNPPAINPTLFGIEVELTQGGGTLAVVVKFHGYSGALGGTGGTAGNSTTVVTLGTNQINIDGFLSAARVERTNS